MVRIWLGHGASGSVATMAPWVDGLRALGLDAAAVALPKGRAERALAPYAAQVPDEPGMLIGGHSFGGRVASMLAAGGDGVPARANPFAGVVTLSFPVHPPGRPERAEERVAHLARIAVPVLMLSGASDPFASVQLLRDAAARLQHGELVLYPGLGHTLAPVRDDALARIAAFARSLEA